MLLSCHTRAIWINAISRGTGTYQLEARIEEAQWWAPAKKGRGRTLADRLATGLREQWEKYRDTKLPR